MRWGDVREANESRLLLFLLGVLVGLLTGRAFDYLLSLR